jgi:hypothetical protein
MRSIAALVAACLLVALAACQPTGTAPVPSGGSAGAQGIGYCDSPPSDPDDLSVWNERCFPT